MHVNISVYHLCVLRQYQLTVSPVIGPYSMEDILNYQQDNLVISCKVLQHHFCDDLHLLRI